MGNNLDNFDKVTLNIFEMQQLDALDEPERMRQRACVGDYSKSKSECSSVFHMKLSDPLLVQALFSARSMESCCTEIFVVSMMFIALDNSLELSSTDQEW